MEFHQITNNNIGFGSTAIGVKIYGRGTSIWSGVSINNNSNINGRGGEGIRLNAEGYSHWSTFEVRNNTGVIGTDDSDTGTTRGGIDIVTLDSASFDELLIENNTRISGSAYAIRLTNSFDSNYFGKVSIANNNLISGNGVGSGIIVVSENSSSYQNLTISGNNAIQAGTRAIDISSTSGTTFNLTILNNSGVAGGTDGIRLHASNASTWSGLIENNRLTGNGSAGINVDWTSGLTIRSGLLIQENSIAYEIGFLSDSYNIDTLTNVRENAFTSSKWYIKDVHPDLTTYINIRSGVLGDTDNTYANAFISFLNDRNPNGIRPADQFNMWNETRFYGYLADISKNDSPQFQIGVDNQLTKENDVIRLNNSAFGGNTDGRFRLSDFTPSNTVFTSNGNFVERGYAFRLERDAVITHLIGGMSVANQGQVRIYGATVDGTTVTKESTPLTSAVLTGNTRDQEIELETPLTLTANTWYVITQLRFQGNEAEHFQSPVDYDVNSIISNTIISDFLPSTGGNYMFNTNEGSEQSIRPPVGFIYESASSFDIANININTSGIRIYSSGVDQNGTVLNRALLRNIPHADVAVQSGAIFNITAPNVTIEHLTFQHGHDEYELGWFKFKRPILR